jgi:hypothetical protein
LGGKASVSNKRTASNSFKVVSVSRVVTTPGQTLQITGTNFQPSLSVASISGITLAESPSATSGSNVDVGVVASPVKVVSSKYATVDIPKQMPFGKYTLTLAQGDAKQNVTLFSDGGLTDYPIFTGELTEICAGKKFYNTSGELKDGTKDCTSAPLPECSRDGETGCVATPRYAVADTTTVASSVVSGNTVAGVLGAVTLPEPCSVDGGTNCTASPAYPAAKLTNFNGADIRTGTTVAGVAGLLSGALPSCIADGGVACIANLSFAAAATSGLAGKILSGSTVAGVAGNVTLPLAVNVRSTNGAFGVGGMSLSPTLADCAADGDVGCVAVGPTYAAAFKTGLASKVLKGSTVAGVAGNVTLPASTNVLASNGAFGVGGTGSTPTLTLPSASNVRVSNGAYGASGNSITPTLADCSADGATSCVATGGYSAAATSGLAPKIVSGSTVAGIAGIATAESHSNCAADGATGCIAVAAYKAADMTQVTAANIKSGVTIANVVGAYPSVTYPLPNASTTADLSSLAGSTAAGSYEWWASNGTRYTGTISDAGTVTPTTASQIFNASVYRQFTLAGDANLTTANIKKNVALFGVTGDYPSSTNPLAGADSTADLDLATFDAKIKSATNFEWFSSDGSRHQNTGDADITAANIANGVTIFGAAGLLQGSGPIDPWNVRSGITIGGVTGKLPVNCRNQGSSAIFTMATPKAVTNINTTNYQLTVPSHGFTSNQTVRVNYSTAPTGLSFETTYYVIFVDANTIKLSGAAGPGAAVVVTDAGADVTIHASGTGSLNTIASIDDYYTNKDYSDMFPYSDLWASANTCAGVEATPGDNNVWKDVTTDGNTNASTCSDTPANCTYQDKVSGLWWSKSPGQKDWANALLYCSNLTHNNRNGWRVPTQKELMNAYEHGIITASNDNWLTTAQLQYYFWSSSTLSYSVSDAWYVSPDNGDTGNNPKHVLFNVTCVR